MPGRKDILLILAVLLIALLLHLFAGRMPRKGLEGRTVQTPTDDVVIIIPEKADVTISEDSEGYVSNFRLDGETAGEEVSSRTFLVESSTKLTVTNTKTGQIPTGVVLPIGGMVAFALIILSGAVYTILNKRRYQKEL